jgi:Zn-dependent metalloprotease
MNKRYTLKRAFQLIAFLVTSSLMAQNSLPKGVSSLSYSTQSSIPAFLKFEDNAGPAVAEFFSYLQANYPTSKDITWKEIQNDKDQLGFSNVRYVELVNGIPVNGSMLILHAKNGRVQSFNGETFTDNLPGRIPTEVDEEQAVNSALKYVGAKTYKWQLPAEEAFIKKEQNNPRATFFPKAELFYVKSGKNELSLACRFDIYAQEPMSRKYVFVRASDNKVISS